MVSYGVHGGSTEYTEDPRRTRRFFRTENTGIFSHGVHGGATENTEMVSHGEHGEHGEHGGSTEMISHGEHREYTECTEKIKEV